MTRQDAGIAALRIDRAQASDVDAVSQLYDELNDYLVGRENSPGWIKGVYPTREEAAHFYESGALYVAKIDGEIAGSCALTHEHEKDPESGSWQVEAADDEVFAIHVFTVHPTHLRKGVGSAMLRYAYELGKQRGLKALRLDVYEHNLPAIRTYERNGFVYIDTVDLGLGYRGLNWFRLYERVIV